MVKKIVAQTTVGFAMGFAIMQGTKIEWIIASPAVVRENDICDLIDNPDCCSLAEYYGAKRCVGIIRVEIGATRRALDARLVVNVHGVKKSGAWPKSERVWKRIFLACQSEVLDSLVRSKNPILFERKQGEKMCRKKIKSRMPRRY